MISSLTETLRLLNVSRMTLGLAIAAGLAVASLYAVGVLKDGWFLVPLLAPVALALLSPREKPWVTNLLLGLAATCATVTAFDLALRLVLGRTLHHTPDKNITRRLPVLPFLGRWDANVTLDQEATGDLANLLVRPDLAESRRIVFATDSRGFRNADIRAPIDLVILGDSFGAGIGTTQDKIFASLLQERYGYHTYSLSFPSGPYSQYLNLALEAPHLPLADAGQIAWVFFNGNDLTDHVGETWDLDDLPLNRGLWRWRIMYKTFRARSPLRNLGRGLERRIKGSPPGDVVVRELPDGRVMLFEAGQERSGALTKEEATTHPHFPALVRTFSEVRRLAASQGWTVTLFVIPTKGEVYRWILEQRERRADDLAASGLTLAVLDACDETGLRCHDTTAYLVRKAWNLYDRERALVWWRDDTHLNERGHEAVAHFIAERMRERVE